MTYSQLSPRHTDLSGRVSSTPLMSFDRWLLLSVIGLMLLGLLMVASSSIVISEKLYGQPFHYLFRQLIYLVLGIALSLLVIRVDVQTWQKSSGGLLLLSMLFLMMVLIPGIGRSVNGSYRWIGFGPVGKSKTTDPSPTIGSLYCEI